jgi:non-canonical purine NTP pyrophosphatase (RdgB/HAM1 family)
MAAILRPLGIPLAVTDPIDPAETGETLEENAEMKAVAYGMYIGNMLVERLCTEHGASEEHARAHLRLDRTWVVSEDSGIAVSELGGLPGPWSARFDDCTVRNGQVLSHVPSDRSREEIDAANNRRVLQMIEGVAQPYRAASFGVCLMAANTDGEILFRTSAETCGWVAEEARGEHGFGYDPIFASGTSFGKTWAEIDPMRKNLISHRRKVLQEFTVWIARELKKGDDR